MIREIQEIIIFRIKKYGFVSRVKDML